MAKIDGKYEQFWTENLLSKIKNEDSITKLHHLIPRYLHQRHSQIENILANIENDDIDLVMVIEQLWEDLEIARKQILYTIDRNDYYAENIHPGQMGMCFDIYSSKGKLGSLELSIPGKHNVYNALAAVSVADNAKIPFEGIKTAIESFKGAGRRFERLGEFDGITLVDDYAHHPTEIEATLSAAKKLNHKNIIAVFQPFTFSRTALLKNDFIKALSVADKVILTPIMGSREINTYGISSEDIAKGLRDAVCVPDFKGVVQTIEKVAKSGDIVITMGGGDIYKAAYMYRDLKTK